MELSKLALKKGTFKFPREEIPSLSRPLWNNRRGRFFFKLHRPAGRGVIRLQQGFQKHENENKEKLL